MISSRPRVAGLRLIPLLALAAILPACSGGMRTPGAGRDPEIRALVAERESVTINVGGAFTVQAGGIVLTRGDAPASVTVTRDGYNLQVHVDPGSSIGVTGGEVTVAPASGVDFELSGATYAGRVVVKVGDGSNLMAINVLPVETYLEGVVPHEIGNPGPDAYAAVEAQAVAARTYSLARIEERREEPFDVYAGVRDQVYRGKEKTSRTASAAVRETRGVVLQNGGHLCRTYYSATCGGHTSDIRRVWPDRESASYLYGALDRTPGDGGSFCAWVRNFRWRYTFSGKELGVILHHTLPLETGVPASQVGSFVDLRVAERSPSGRVRRLEIETTARTFVIEGDRIRWVLMTDVDKSRILPSTLFDVEKRMSDGRAGYVSIVGGGNGHGVGMCQNGAIGMARKGYSYRMILSHYYPGAEPVQRY